MPPSIRNVPAFSVPVAVVRSANRDVFAIEQARGKAAVGIAALREPRSGRYESRDFPLDEIPAVRDRDLFADGHLYPAATNFAR
jgi:hypothetical protein